MYLLEHLNSNGQALIYAQHEVKRYLLGSDGSFHTTAIHMSDAPSRKLQRIGIEADGKEFETLDSLVAYVSTMVTLVELMRTVPFLIEESISARMRFMAERRSAQLQERLKVQRKALPDGSLPEFIDALIGYSLDDLRKYAYYRDDYQQRG